MFDSHLALWGPNWAQSYDEMLNHRHLQNLKIFVRYIFLNSANLFATFKSIVVKCLATCC